MRSSLPLLRIAAVLAMASAGQTAASDQSALYVKHEGQMHLVRRMQEYKPYIEINGKLVPASGNKAMLAPAPGYVPVCINVLNAERGAMSNADRMTSQYSFRAQFESPIPCDNVFLVLDIGKDSKDSRLLCYEIGHLDPLAPRVVSCGTDLPNRHFAGQTEVHVFVGGAEALNTTQTVADRQAALAKMVAKRIAGVQQANPRPFVGFTPRYPESLLKTGRTGGAVVSLRVASDGSVQDLVVKSATDPAFGEVALAAVQQWHFLPKVEKGRAVETAVDVPFEFAPPERAAGGN